MLFELSLLVVPVALFYALPLGDVSRPPFFAAHCLLFISKVSGIIIDDYAELVGIKSLFDALPHFDPLDGDVKGSVLIYELLFLLSGETEPCFYFFFGFSYMQSMSALAPAILAISSMLRFLLSARLSFTG